MLAWIVPALAAVAPQRSPIWTALDVAQPSTSAVAAPTRMARRRCRRRGNPSAFLDSGSGIDGPDPGTSDELRLHLTRLQEEAESTRSKGNSARMRLMRLTEVVEQLQKLATAKVKAGKEEDARELLLQKKKIMLALEKSKDRIELLDKLSSKLNEAILLKETELIGNISKQPSILVKDADSPVRVVPPTILNHEEIKEIESSESLGNHVNSGKIEDEGPEDNVNSGEIEDEGPEDNRLLDSTKMFESAKEYLNAVADINEASMEMFIGVTTYKALLEHVDGQLEGLQEDLAAYMRLSKLTTEQERRWKNKHIQDLHGILHDIYSLRERIVRIMLGRNGETCDATNTEDAKDVGIRVDN